MVEILEDLFFIERGFLNGNHFVYRGVESVLIDTGYIRDIDYTISSIENLGVDLSRVSRIVNTHSHCDHVGGNHLIQQNSGCEIALHRVGKHFIDTRDDWATWWRYYDQEAMFFSCTTGLEDGDIIPVGPHQFEVLYTPGHAADGIVLYNRPARVLISSDTLWESDVAVMTLRVEGSRALFCQLEALERLAALEIDIVYPGHGPPFNDAGRAIERAKKRLKTYLAEPSRLGQDVLKKIIIYSLLMRPDFEENAFYNRLFKAPWFRETVDLYFDGKYREKYDQVLEGLTARGLVRRKNGYLSATINP